MVTIRKKLINRYSIIFILFLFNISVLYAQDNCNTAVDLTVNPDDNCSSLTTVTGYGFTDSGVTPLGCQIPAGNPDWWGKFTATSDYTAVRVNNYGVSYSHGRGILIYSGACATNMNLVECGIFFMNGKDLPMEAIAPTIPGDTYYVRLTDAVTYSGYDIFDICVYEFDYDENPDPGTCGDNMDFELGDFSTWTGYTGSCCPITMTSTGFQNQGINSALHLGTDEPSQHTITTGLNRDPLTRHNVPIVAPQGGDYSVRIGNAYCYYGAECIERSFTVTPDNAGITYFYAVVLEDPEHEYEDQPRFFVEVTDADGELIDCAQYEVVSGYGTGDWESTSSSDFALMMWKDWVPVGFDLTPQIGTDVTIKACTGDCNVGAHFGYAYFDIVCGPLEPEGFSVCTTGEPVELCAPQGYIEWQWSTGDSTECINVDDPQPGAIYTITVTNVAGCTSIVTDTLQVYTGQAWEDTVICPGETVTLYSDCDYPAAFSWTSDPPGFISADQNITVTPDDIGVYYYIVEMIPLDDQYPECTVIDTVVVEVVNCNCVTPPVSFEIIPPPCCGDNAIITYTGPGLGTDDETELVNPTWAWDIGSNGTLVSGNLNGTGTVPGNIEVSYPCNGSITVTLDVQNYSDGMDCDPSTFTLSSFAPEELTCSASGTDVLCYGVCDGTASIVANGGTGVHSFIWDNGAGNNSTATGLCANVTYTVTVSDANGCTCVTSVFIDEPPEIVLNVIVVDAQCNQSDGSATVSVSGGTPQYSYLWDAATGSQTTATASNLQGGTYTVTVTDANGCTAEISATVNFTNAPELSITGTDVTCYGFSDGIIDLTVTGGTPAYSYNWSDGSTNEDMSNVSPGDYSVTVTDIMGCASIISIAIDQPPELVTSLSGNDLLCYGGSDGNTNLEVTGGTPDYSYIWSPGGETTQDLNGVPAGQYEVTVTDANQCTAVNTIILNEPPELTSIISGSDQLCTGDEIGTVDVEVDGGTPPYTYFWQPTDETTQEIDSLPSGEYTVLITDDNGCTTTNSIIIDEPYPILTQMAGTDVLCYGYTEGEAGVTASGGTQPYAYIWNTGANTQNISNIGAGTYYVTVTDQNNCTAADNIIINEPPELIVNLPDPGWICIGESVTLIANASGGTPGYDYIWNNGTMQQSNNVSPLVTTDYSVSTTDINGCLANATVTVNVYGPLSIHVYPDDTICAGETATIYAGYEGGMGEPYTLTLNGNTVIETPYTVSPSVTTVYEVCVNDACTTPQVCDDLEVVVIPDPPVDFVADIYEGCVPLTVHFSEQNTHEGQTYQWDFSDPWGSTSALGKYPVHTFENPGIYDVSCTVTSVHGCTSTWTWYEMISVWPDPVAAFFPYPKIATIIEPYIYFENNSSTYYITNWTFGDGDSSNVIHPQHKYDSPGTYNVMLAVETEHGCVDTTWSEVVIQDIITFYAPTAFSPDFDNMNGLFSPIGHGIDPDNWHLMIYDRWGEKVWETNIYDVDEETGEVRHGWDGTIRGRGIGESAVYSWLVVYNDVTGAEHQHAGLVTLIR